MTEEGRPIDSLPVPPATPQERAEAAAVGAASFVLSLRSRGIGDVRVLRAMELVPRDVFAPRRFADLARADLALPLACGQTMTAPGTVATLLVALSLDPGQRVLEIGTGSGYVTALLAELGGGVVSLERFGTLVEGAAERLRLVGALARVRLETADGLAVRPRERFDRILLNGSVAAIPDTLTDLLAPGGRLVGGLRTQAMPRLARIERGRDGAATPELFGPIRLSPLIPGLARAL